MNRKAALALAEKFNKTMNARSKEMKTARDYGSGVPLYHAEVHLLDTISQHGDENGKELAARIGVTKGAVAQIVKKLTEKRLIESYQIPENKKEIYFRLSELGKQAVRGHKKYHEQLNASLFAYIEELGESDVAVIMEFLDVMLQGLPNT
jgi:DNA-binding MarR family transcriptional regulator